MAAGQNGEASGPQFICTSCGKRYSLDKPLWRCGCGGVLDIINTAGFDRSLIDFEAPGIRRYRNFIPLPRLLTLGEGRTPFLPYASPWLPSSVSLRLLHDHLNPSGSFKDRGAAVLLSAVRRYGIEHIVEDSSGNAGAAIAAYAAAAGVNAQIFVPENTSIGKTEQIRAYGAEVVKVPGNREDTAEAAFRAAESSYYASHSWNPFFFQGTKTVAYEICEHLGWRGPDAMVLPCGNGTLLLGAYIGWRELLKAGAVSRMPKLVAVQSAGCAPVYEAWASKRRLPGGEQAGGRTPVPGNKQAAGGGGKPAAEGIQVAAPVRLRQILEAADETGGLVCTVTDEEVWASCREAWEQGVYIEPTAAVSLAGCKKYLDLSGNHNELISAVFTGHGLKLQGAS